MGNSRRTEGEYNTSEAVRKVMQGCGWEGREGKERGEEGRRDGKEGITGREYFSYEVRRIKENILWEVKKRQDKARRDRNRKGKVVRK